MKTTYVDPATGERHVLVRIASSAVALMQEAMDADTRLSLRNQLAIMRALEATAHGPIKAALHAQLTETEARLAQPEPLEAAA